MHFSSIIGKFNNERDSETCQHCPSGYSSDAVDREECSECPFSYSMCVNNNEATEPCVAGKFSVTCQINVMSCLSYNECRNCPSGWQGLGGDSSCVECETGRYQDQTSQSVCKICENGRYNALSKQILPSTCLACSPGQVSKNDNGAAMCIKCIPGMFAAGEAFSTCTDCAKGRYMEKEGQSFCRICQTGQFVNLTGSTI